MSWGIGSSSDGSGWPLRPSCLQHRPDISTQVRLCPGGNRSVWSPSAFVILPPFWRSRPCSTDPGGRTFLPLGYRRKGDGAVGGLMVTSSR